MTKTCRYCHPENFPNTWKGQPYDGAKFVCIGSEDDMDMDILYAPENGTFTTRQASFHLLTLYDGESGVGTVDVPLYYCPYCGRKLGCLDEDDEPVLKDTLDEMDEAMKNLNTGDVSDPIDLSDFTDEA